MENTVERLRLVAFRNYGDQEIILDPGFNMIVGPNAQGKTNLLEAVYLLSTTQLLRGHRDFEAILEGHDAAEVSATMAGSGTVLRVSLQRGQRKRASINSVALPRAADLLGRLPCVSITAHDMALVRGEPSERRLFLDLQMSSLSPAYLRALSTYKRALEQRNALLRSAQDHAVAVESFEAWEAPMAHAGATLREMRADYVERLAEFAPRFHAELAPGEPLRCSYSPKDEATDESSMLRLLGERRGVDTARGTTSLGPHRDDIAIEAGGRDARLYGSQGQQRTAVIALKMGAWQLAREQIGEPPILLLDDILSDLDERRRAALVESVLAHARQAILTATEADSAGPRILGAAKLFDVREGSVCER